MKTVSAEFSNAFAASSMTVKPRVTVEFGNNRFNDSQVVTASSEKLLHRGLKETLLKEVFDFWNPEEVFNNKNRNSMRWMVCDQGAKAHKEGVSSFAPYRAINPDDAEYERGWWSFNKSDPTTLAGWTALGFNDAAWPVATSNGAYSTNLTPWFMTVSGWTDNTAEWIWDRASRGPVPIGSVYFRKIINVGAPTAVNIDITCDNQFALWVNGVLVKTGYDWPTKYTANVTLVSGNNQIAVKGTNDTVFSLPNPAGLLVSVRRVSDSVVIAKSDNTWKVSGYPAATTDGLFDVPEYVESTFTARNCTKIALYTTEGYNNMKKVSLEYKNSSDVWTAVPGGTDFVLGSTTYKNEFSFPSATTVKGLRAYVKETFGCGEYARLNELQGLFVADVSDDVITCDVNEIREEYSGTVPVGTTRANSLNLQLQNVDQQYSIENTGSAYYPYVDEQNKITVEYGINIGSAYVLFSNVANSNVIAQDTSSFDFSQGLDVRCYVAMNSWTLGALQTYVAHRWISAGISWQFRMNTSNRLEMIHCADGTSAIAYAATAALTGVVNGLPTWVRVAWRRSDGRIQFFQSSDGTNWTQVGANVTGATTALFSINDPIEIGSCLQGTTHRLQGKVYSAEIRTTQDGTVVASPDFTDKDDDTNYFDAQGNLWEIGSGAVFVSSYEYTPMGTYWTDPWSNDGSSVTASVSGRDASRFLQDEQLPVGRVWENDNVGPVIKNLLARKGFSPDEMEIDTAATRGFQILYLKDKTVWDFLAEVAYADQGMFGFNGAGKFVYHSYNKLNTAPHTTSQYDYNWDTNIIDGSVQGELYVNKVIVNVSPTNRSESGPRPIWAPESPSNLKYNLLTSSINSIVTTIPMSLNGTTQNWPLSGYFLIDNELVKYDSRTDSNFTSCTRGYLDTVPAAHSTGALIGEAKYYEMDFDNAPALQVKEPFVTAIDVLKVEEGEGTPQAKIVMFKHDAFSGKFVVANIVPFLTHLMGTGPSQKNADFDLPWDTLISGIVAIEKTGAQKVGKKQEPVLNADWIRRYGKNEIEVNNDWIQTPEHASQIAQLLIDEYKTPREILRLQVVGYPALELGDRVRVVNYPQLSIVNKEYHIIELDYTYDGGLLCNVTMREVKP